MWMASPSTQLPQKLVWRTESTSPSSLSQPLPIPRRSLSPTWSSNSLPHQTLTLPTSSALSGTISRRGSPQRILALLALTNPSHPTAGCGVWTRRLNSADPSCSI
ncbi:hypothetical protein BLNAU_8059 [Blattamonas nauphoetae]|uniref:Movement protein n=1 Tax=Blattamonas nauphoetae TaxID=2049346 RepID=A0ABQ9XZU3_9EUKA|nr:hypothetical protein BLNAU_8059 [Blattamonas nauphoetae]